MLKKILLIASFLCFSITAQDEGVPDDTASYDETYNGYEETNGASNTNAPSGAFLGIGIGYLWNLNANNPSYQAFLGRKWGAGDYWAFNLIAEGATDFDNAWFVDGGLMLELYPLPSYTVISPYLAIGLGVGWATATNLDNDKLGLNVNGTIGLRLFKSSPVGVFIEAGVDWLTRDVVGANNPVLVTGRAGIMF